MAYEERQPPSGLIFHSDRGAQYTSHRFQQLLHEHNTEQSFSQPGKPHDNAVAESFFASLKKEELYRREHPSDRAFQASVASYIEILQYQTTASNIEKSNTMPDGRKLQQERQMRHLCSNRLDFTFSASI